MVTIKMGKKLVYIYFYCLNFLLFNLRWSENRIFISDKFCVFWNTPLMLKIICKTLLMLFYSEIYFLSL